MCFAANLTTDAAADCVSVGLPSPSVCLGFVTIGPLESFLLTLNCCIFNDGGSVLVNLAFSSDEGDRSCKKKQAKYSSVRNESVS